MFKSYASKALLLSLCVVLFTNVLQAQTQVLFDNNNGFLDFSGNPTAIVGSTGKNPGDQMLYESVGVINGIDIDALIITVSVPGSSKVSTYDGDDAVSGAQSLWQPTINLSEVR